MTTVDSHCCRSTYDTCFFVVTIPVTVMCLRASRIILIRTAATTIDVTTVFISSTTIDAGVGNAHHTAMDGYRGIVIGMSVLTAAIDRALDLRTCGCIVRFTNDDFRIIYPSHVVLDSIRTINITARCTKDHTILMAIRTYDTTENTDGSLTSVFCSKSGDGCICILAGIGVSTYRAVCTATIYIM